MGVSQLKYSEPVKLDTDLLDQMCVRIGFEKAEAAISAAMEDLAVLLQYTNTLLRTGEFETLSVTGRQVEAISRRIGMVKLAHIASDMARLCHVNDPAALAACTARLRRVGEQSLIAIWEREDLQI